MQEVVEGHDNLKKTRLIEAVCAFKFRPIHNWKPNLAKLPPRPHTHIYYSEFFMFVCTQKTLILTSINTRQKILYLAFKYSIFN